MALAASKFTYRDDERKPAVPARHEKPICGLTGTKNFVLANAVENMLAEPKVRQSSEVDWLRKEDFGKVPQYLASVKEQVNKEYEMVRTAQLEHTQAHGGGAKMRLLSEEERVEVCFLSNQLSSRLAWIRPLIRPWHNCHLMT